MALTIKTIPLNTDNYSFWIKDEVTGLTGLIDPADLGGIESFFKSHSLNQLDSIFNTHHHGDHVHGNLELKEKYNCHVVGALQDQHRIPGINIMLQGDEDFQWGSLVFQILDLPGHTSGHIAFFCASEKVLFVGDTLFSLGCGRIFEGTAAQMLHSLKKIKALPPDTQIYFAHEYTLKNAEFALTLDPKNQSLQKRIQHCRRLRNQNQPTTPCLLADELEQNPFLRTHTPEIIKASGASNKDEVQVFARIRQMKDHF